MPWIQIKLQTTGAQSASVEDQLVALGAVSVTLEDSARNLDKALFKVFNQLTQVIDKVSKVGWKGTSAEVHFKVDRSNLALRGLTKRVLRYNLLITRFTLKRVPTLSERNVVQLCRLVLTLESLTEFRTDHILRVSSCETLCSTNLYHLKRFIVLNQASRVVKVLVYLVRKGLQKQLLASVAVGVYNIWIPMVSARLYPGLFVEALETGEVFSEKLRSYTLSLLKH